MSKKVFIQESRYSKNSQLARKELYNSYNDRYFNLWLSSREWNGLSRDQREFLMRRFWDEGQVAAFSIISPSKAFMGQKPEDYQDGLLGFAPYAAQAFNMFNFPTKVQLINLRGVPYIPTKLLVAGKDCVLGFATHSRQPIKSLIKPFIDRLVEIEMAIRTNLTMVKKGQLITYAPEDKEAIDNIMRQWNWDEPFIRTTLRDPKSNIPANIAPNYIIDKLAMYKAQVENELLTIMGISNNGNVMKKERLITEEANAFEALTNDYSDSVDQNLKEFCDEIKEVLGFDVSIKVKTSPRMDKIEDNKEVRKDDSGKILPNA